MFVARHKCRLCGEIYNGAITGNKNLVIQSIIDMDNGKYTIPQTPRLVDIHLCKNGDVGCSDFIGWEKGDE